MAWDSFGRYLTDLYTDEAVNIIREHDREEKPLFLVLAHHAVHSANEYQPLQRPPNKADTNDSRSIYEAQVGELDSSVGKVFQQLAESNMLNDTIFIFMSDNGGAAGGFDDNYASNWPLKSVLN